MSTVSAPSRSLVATGATAAAATWLTSLLLAAVVTARLAMAELSTVLVAAAVEPAIAGLAAAAVVGFASGRRDRARQSARCLAAALGAFTYLALGSVVALLGGSLQVGAASLAGAAVGAAAGGGVATILLQRSER